MRLIDGKLLADEILGEIFERGQASGLWEKQLEIGALTYADIEFADGYDSALGDVYRQISDMKTVDAIPIEWIKDYVGFGVSDDTFKRNRRFVLNMIEDWEKENDGKETD